MVSKVDELDGKVADLETGKLNATREAVSTVGGLVKPLATPTEMELVGISPTMEQERVKMDSSLNYNADTKTLSVKNAITNIVIDDTAKTIKLTIE